MLASLSELRRKFSTKKGLLGQAQYLLPGIFLFGVTVFRIAAPTAMETFQGKVFDAYQRLSPREYRPAPVRILDLDDESLKKLGQWPWPRTLVSYVVQRSVELGVAALAFDIVFAEPDRTSPKEVLKYWPETEAKAAVLRHLDSLPDHDGQLAEIIAEAPVITGFALTRGGKGRRPVVKRGVSVFGAPERAIQLLAPYSGAVTNLSEIEEASAGNGSFNADPDPDGMIRKVSLLYRLADKLYPSLALEALRVAQGGTAIRAKTAASGTEMGKGGEDVGFSMVNVGQLNIPTDAFGRVWLHFTEEVPERTIPIWKLFDPEFDGAELEGALVFIGTSAEGLKDLRATPLNPFLPGVEIHAQLTEQILLEHFLNRPYWAVTVELALLLAVGILLIALLPRVGALWCAPLTFGSVFAMLALSWKAFVDWRWLLDPIFPSLGIVAIYGGSSLIAYLRTEYERSHIKGSFARYMSPSLVQKLAENPEQLRLGGEMRPMTLLFCDVRGFTTISEQFTPEGLTQLINAFLTPMTDIIMKRKGTIDKYMGDCIMAFWNAPLDDAHHARNACQSGLEMMERLKPLNDELEAEAKREGRKHVPLNIGIGLNSGECCVGNMGSDQRFDYSVLGDAVNLASRLEGQSKSYGVNIVIGPETRAEASDYASIELDLIRVKGKTVPVHIFALLGDPEMAGSEAFQALSERHVAMIEAYRAQKWKVAKGHLEACNAMDFPLERLYELYADRITKYLAHPPEPDWDGVFTATTK